VHRLELLGRIDLRSADGTELRTVLAQPKRFALLAYLALHTAAGAVRRDKLLSLFWPEMDQEHARKALNKSVHFLRQELGEGAIVSREGDQLAVAPECVSCDAVEFTRAIEQHDEALALDLYRGDLLPAFYVQDAPEFERWLEEARTRLKRLAARASHALAERREREGQATAAVSFARRAVDLTSADERTFRKLLELLDRLGDREGALHAYAQFERRIAAELDAAPAAETQALVARIRAR
jgi:serine/threonine-protein kinase